MSKSLIVLLPLCFVIGLWSIFFALMPKHGTTVYDCRLAEISPDFPVEVKTACRKKLSGRI